ncbi:MAG: ABC transporter permease [Devosia sp.]
MTDLAADPQLSFGTRFRRLMADQPMIPLIVLLLALVLTLHLMSPGIINAQWMANTVKFAIPLAILAGAQTLVMLTGGIDLSVGTVGTMAGLIVATQIPHHDPATTLALAMLPALFIGFANGVGVGVFRVHPLIMTLGTGLIGTGVLLVYQRTVIATGSEIPFWIVWIGTQLTFGIPNALLVFIPLAALIIFLLRSTGFGRQLYALGDNEKAARLSGSSYRQVIIALYVLSSLLAYIAGLLYLGVIRTPSLTLTEPLVLPSVAAAIIGGTSIFGGRGNYATAVLGALILRVLTTLLTVMQVPEGVRQGLFGLVILVVTAVYLRIIDDR